MNTAGAQILSTVVAGAGGGNSFLDEVVQSGLMAEYRIQSGETAASLIDYSGNKRNATGTVGTAPTIAANTGGLVCVGTGAVSLPAILNSALTIMVYFQTQTLAAAGGAGSQIVVGSNTSHDIGFGLLRGFLAPNAIIGYSNSTYKSLTCSTFWGSGSIALAMDTNDKFYQNGVEYPNNYYQQHSSAGNQTAGNYQLGGFTGNYVTGTIYYAVFYNRVLNPSEIAQNHRFMLSVMAARGVPFSPAANDGVAQGFFEGDSIMAGQNGGTISQSLTLTGAFTVSNNAVSGFKAVNQDASAPAFLSILRPNASVNFVVQESCTNDLAAGTTAAVTFAAVVDLARQAKLASPNTKYFCVTALDRTNGSTPATIAAYNTYVRANWKQSGLIDGLIDSASDSVLGAEFASNSFTGVGLHPGHAQYNNNLDPPYQRAINRAYGNQDFTTANTYVAADPSASTVTACSCTSNIVTCTSTMNPPVGSVVNLEGVATAGYNTPYPGALVLTTSGSAFTIYNPNSSLATDNSGGTAFIASQKDIDTAFIVNFGSGNFTLESALGYTGQNIKIKNINAASTTIVPWMVELINGASSFTLAAGAAVTLQSVYSAYTSGTITAAAAAVGGNTTYTGTFSAAFVAAVIAGMFVSINGFGTAANNGVFVVVSCNSTTLIVANAAGALQTGQTAVAYNTQSNWITV